MTTYCFGFSDNLLGSHCLLEGWPCLGEISWPAVCAADLSCGTSHPAFRADGWLQREGWWRKTRSKCCYDSGHASVELDLRNWGSTSAEPQPRGLTELALCTSQVQHLYMSDFLSLTPSVMSWKQTLFLVMLIFEPSFINVHEHRSLKRGITPGHKWTSQSPLGKQITVKWRWASVVRWLVKRVWCRGQILTLLLNSRLRLY